LDSSVRAKVQDTAERLGIEDDDLRDLVAVFDGGACTDTRERMAELVDRRLAAAQEALVGLVEHTAAVNTTHGGDRPGMPQPVAELHHATVDRLGVVAQLQAAAAVLAEPSAPGACREDCPCARASTASGATARVPATRMALAVSALDGGAGPDIVCTLDGGLDAMRGRIGEWQAVIGHATGRRPVDGGVALTYDYDPAIAVELARLASAEFACCSFFEFSLTVGPDGMRFAVSAPDEARDVITAVFGTAEAAPVGGL
jgi:hypothetical protein